MLVSELMSGEPALIRAEAPLEEAGAEMIRLRIRHLPVVDTNGCLAGVVTDHAVFKHGGFLDGDRGWLAYEPAFDGYTAATVAVPVDVVVGPDESLVTVLRRLGGTKQDCVIVVDEREHPLGILTEHDALKIALDVLDPELLGDQEGSSPVVSVERTDSAKDALELMRRQGVRHLVVTNVNGSVYGVVSYGDLVADDASRRPELKAEDVVRSLQVRTGNVGTPLRDLAALMKRDAIGCVPILDEEGRPVAIVTRRDIVEAAVAGLEREELFA